MKPTFEITSSAGYNEETSEGKAATFSLGLVCCKTEEPVSLSHAIEINRTLTKMVKTKLSKYDARLKENSNLRAN